MLPIHLAIGIVEGLATAFVLAFVWSARPELRGVATAESSTGKRRLVVGTLATTLLLGAAVSWFASTRPDGLEWSIEQTAGAAEISSSGVVHDQLAELQALWRRCPTTDSGRARNLRRMRQPLGLLSIRAPRFLESSAACW